MIDWRRSGVFLHFYAYKREPGHTGSYAFKGHATTSASVFLEGLLEIRDCTGISRAGMRVLFKKSRRSETLILTVRHPIRWCAIRFS